MATSTIYKLDKEDVQEVALEVLDRKLTNKEIEKIKDRIAENIDWFSAIEYAILELIEDKETSRDKKVA